MLAKLTHNTERVIRTGLEGLAGIALLGMMLVTTFDVIGRFFFNAPLLGAIELIQLMLAVVIFCSFPVVCWKEEHIAVDLLDQWVPAWVVPWRQILINGICTFALYVMADRIWAFAGRSMSYGDVTEFLRIPVGYLIYLMSLMAWIAAAFTLVRALFYVPEIFGYKTWAHHDPEKVSDQYLGSVSHPDKNNNQPNGQ